MSLKKNNIQNGERNIDENMKLIKRFRLQKIVDVNMVRIFVALWLVVAIVVSIPVFRPEKSDVEKRELKKFPKFSFSALVSGEYFDEIGLWYSDTFPMRDDFVSFNTQLTNKYGINDIKVQGDIVEADEIPDKVDSNGPIVIAPPPPSDDEPQPPAIEELGATVLIGDTVYEYYNFNNEVADTYSATINRAAMLLEGKAKVYDMIVPTSMEIALPDEYKASITKTSNQKRAIEYMYSRMAQNVIKVDAYSALEKHKKEYLYFRTDHHWTALGAYYSYCELMKAKGATPATLDMFEEVRYDGFLGTFYAGSGQNEALAKNPDYIMAYKPKGMEKIHTFTADGTIDYSIVSNGDKLNPVDKYLTFICGDKPYGVMTNPAINDGSACLVIKESYGNAMVAFLTQNYQNVYVADYRYVKQAYNGTLAQFVEEYGIQDVMFVNNVGSTRSKSLVSAMAAFIG